ncbi:TIGR03086 family metal-binding protein [Actinocrispum wychmicini]|uniref:Uncharacterized protein (TIGR03086 family) n=1 Tax=Actinocrispum wychmicini TaxID=1213861 RepID=A0A4R2JVU9_9PSEU|nr:TIGR03086 family metal-binding protein [Actinocrispum wychmicini]TCO58295.1 uncharacterized protein (TIGR03086 family) [Actinocrispum wychmicini]
MDVRTAATVYYDAWMTRAGDMTEVPLAAEFVFTGPVASFDSADGFRAMAKQAGAAVRRFQVRHQFVDGNLVCSVIDWEMTMLPGVLTAAEVLEVRDGRIVRGELIYDAQELREAMARPAIFSLLAQTYQDTAEMLGGIDDAGWVAQSGCARWTVRQAGNHLVGALTLLARIAGGEPVDVSDVDAQRTAGTDWPDLVEAFGRAAERCLTLFSGPEVLQQRFDIPAPDVSGERLAAISLLESLVHGWDIAVGAGVAYQPDDAVVEYARAAFDEVRRGDQFAAAIVVGAGADPFTALLGHLGRRA